MVLCLVATTTWADVAIDATHFPDPGFRKWLASQDFGKDGIITTAEIKEITNLTVWSDTNVGRRVLYTQWDG